MDIYKTIRNEILQASETRYAIAKKTGVSEQILCKVYHSEQPSLSLKAAERLLDYFGYSVRKDGK